MKLASLFACLLALPLSGCALFGITEKVDVDHDLIQLESGVEIQTILPGQGEGAQLGDTLTLDYVGYLADGSVFDSSRDRGVPVTIVLGEAPLEGWNEGLVGMMVGGRRHLSIPPELAYGENGIEGLIPPNEALVFEIELLELAFADADADVDEGVDDEDDTN